MYIVIITSLHLPPYDVIDYNLCHPYRLPAASEARQRAAIPVVVVGVLHHPGSHLQRQPHRLPDGHQGQVALRHAGGDGQAGRVPLRDH